MAFNHALDDQSCRQLDEDIGCSYISREDFMHGIKGMLKSYF